jgi:acyl carrier protein
MNDMSIERRLIDFISTEIAYDRGSERIAPDEPLLDGVLDSTDVLLLLVFMEEEFRVRIPDDDVVPENFSTVERLAALLRAKLRQGSDHAL